MRPRLFLLGIAAALAVLLAACGQVPVTASAPPSSTAPAASANIDYAALGMSATDIQLWQEQGVANVATPDAASVLAGFTVKTPSYLPVGMGAPFPYTVLNNAPMLKRTGSSADPLVSVRQVWGNGTQGTWIMLLESARPFDHDTGTPTPTRLCGLTVQTGTNPGDSGTWPGARFFHWEQDGVTFDLTGLLTRPISEADLEKVACSLINP